LLKVDCGVVQLNALRCSVTEIGGTCGNFHRSQKCELQSVAFSVPTQNYWAEQKAGTVPIDMENSALPGWAKTA
jgi:hypothetical protein